MWRLRVSQINLGSLSLKFCSYWVKNYQRPLCSGAGGWLCVMILSPRLPHISIGYRELKFQIIISRLSEELFDFEFDWGVAAIQPSLYYIFLRKVLWGFNFEHDRDFYNLNDFYFQSERTHYMEIKLECETCGNNVQMETKFV